MKATKLTIKNIGKISEMILPIDKPLILFYGEIRQGKTTILNCVRWVCGGEFPSDIIKHGEKEGSIELEFDGGMVTRYFYFPKAGGTEAKARPVLFIRNGRPVDSPVSEIKRLLNPFLLDQDHLRNKNEPDRKRFFVELFGVDTTSLDAELLNVEKQASGLREKIKGYGEIDLTPSKTIDSAALKAKLDSVKLAHRQNVSAIRASNAGIRGENEGIASAERNARNDEEEIKRLKSKIAEIQAEVDSLEADNKTRAVWLATHIRMPEETEPEPPDTSALEAQIEAAAAANVRAEQFVANQKRADMRTADAKNLSDLETRGRTIKADKIKKLKGISDSCGINGLAFDESGDFTYHGTTAGMLSTSEIMQLSSELSSLYPEGFGLQLLDRAESLGKSIFEFVDRATSEKKTILATIVGEKPANVPENIGVFVVENGTAK